MPRRSYRAILVAPLAAVMLAVAACSDATGPSGTLELSVSPDSVRMDPATGLALVSYTFRNAGDVDVFTSFHADVEGQTASGGWQTIPDADPVRYISDLSFQVRPEFTGQRAVYLQLKPGRYRMTAGYRWGTGSASAASPVLHAVSNPFTVM